MVRPVPGVFRAAALAAVLAAPARADISFHDSLVHEDPGTGQYGTQGGWVVPNELEWRVYKDVLRGKTGALISVGTFRALHDAAFGDFSDVILFDIDQGAVGFNRTNITLIAQAEDRYEYMAQLLGKGLPQNLLRAARGGRIGDAEFFASLRQAPVATSPILPPKAKSDECYGPDGYDRPNIECLASLISKHILPYPERWRNSLFGSDAIFAKVKAMAVAGRFYVMTGNLLGDAGMRSLSAALEKGGICVSAVDLSNTVAYFFQDRRPPAEGANNLFRNLEALPRTPDSVVLFTTGSGENVAGDRWNYYAVPFKDFLERRHDLMYGYQLDAFLGPRKPQPFDSRMLFAPEGFNFDSPAPGR